MFRQKASKLVWTINGYLLLLFLIAAIWVIGADVISNLRREAIPVERGAIVGEASRVAQRLAVTPQHLEYDHPERVADSKYFLSSVYVMDKELPPEVQKAIESSGDVSRNLIGARVNVLIFSEDRTEVTKLIDGFGYINRIANPRVVQRYRQSSPEVGLPQHILFEIALRDTNGDQRINAEDRMAYFLSDYSGKNLRQITPDSLNLVEHWYTSDNQGIFFEEVVVGSTEKIYGVEYTLDERRLYYYDLESEQFEAFDELQVVFEEVIEEYKAGSPQ